MSQSQKLVWGKTLQDTSIMLPENQVHTQNPIWFVRFFFIRWFSPCFCRGSHGIPMGPRRGRCHRAWTDSPGRHGETHCAMRWRTGPGEFGAGQPPKTESQEDASSTIFPESVRAVGSSNSGWGSVITSYHHIFSHLLTSSHIFSHLLTSSHIFSSSHLFIFTSSHLHIFSSPHILSSYIFSHLLIFSHVHILSSHLLTSSHLHIFSSSHMFISSHIFSSSYLLTSSHIFSSLSSHIFSSSSHLHIFSHLLTSSLSCLLALKPSCPLLLPSFLFLS